MNKHKEKMRYLYPYDRRIQDGVLCKNQINARALIGQPAMVYCAGKFMEKLCVS